MIFVASSSGIQAAKWSCKKGVDFIITQFFDSKNDFLACAVVWSCCFRFDSTTMKTGKRRTSHSGNELIFSLKACDNSPDTYLDRLSDNEELYDSTESAKVYARVSSPRRQ